MKIRFEDADGNSGIIRDDFIVEDYNGPDMWRVRIEDTLRKTEATINGDKEGMEPDSDIMAFRHLGSLEGEERMTSLTEMLSTLTLIRSAVLEK